MGRYGVPLFVVCIVLYAFPHDEVILLWPPSAFCTSVAAWCPCSNRLYEGLPVSWPPCKHSCPHQAPQALCVVYSGLGVHIYKLPPVFFFGIPQERFCHYHRLWPNQQGKKLLIMLRSKFVFRWFGIADRSRLQVSCLEELYGFVNTTHILQIH